MMQEVNLLNFRRGATVKIVKLWGKTIVPYTDWHSMPELLRTQQDLEKMWQFYPDLCIGTINTLLYPFIWISKLGAFVSSQGYCNWHQFEDLEYVGDYKRSLRYFTAYKVRTFR